MFDKSVKNIQKLDAWVEVEGDSACGKESQVKWKRCSIAPRDVCQREANYLPKIDIAVVKMRTNGSRRAPELGSQVRLYELA